MDEAVTRLRALGFCEPDATVILEHFLDADRRGKHTHGVMRIDWLAGQEFDPTARAARVVSEPGFERWEGRGAVGYLTMHAIVEAQLAHPPEHARVVVAAGASPLGVLGYWVRRLAQDGLVAALTATSPRRLASPAGGPPLAGTNPLAIAVPSSNGRPLVADVSMGKVTHGHVLAGEATLADLVPFGGEQAYKAFALAVGLHALVDALTGGDDYGAVLVVARPEGDPVPALRETGVRLPGDK